MHKDARWLLRRIETLSALAPVIGFCVREEVTSRVESCRCNRMPQRLQLNLARPGALVSVPECIQAVRASGREDSLHVQIHRGTHPSG